MSVLPDPADLVAIADRIAAHAATARDRASRLDHAVAGTGWSGTAAAVFRDEAHLATDTLRNAASRLDDAAAALRRHAARISGMLADLARLGAAELDLLKDGLAHPDRVLGDVGDVIGDGVHVVGGALDLIGL